jgi:hypothetical protein
MWYISNFTDWKEVALRGESGVATDGQIYLI